MEDPLPGALPGSASISPSRTRQPPTLTSHRAWPRPPVLRGEEVDRPVLADLAPVRLIDVDHLADAEAQGLARPRWECRRVGAAQSCASPPTPVKYQTGAAGRPAASPRRTEPSLLPGKAEVSSTSGAGRWGGQFRPRPLPALLESPPTLAPPLYPWALAPGPAPRPRARSRSPSPPRPPRDPGGRPFW